MKSGLPILLKNKLLALHVLYLPPQWFGTEIKQITGNTPDITLWLILTEFCFREVTQQMSICRYNRLNCCFIEIL